MKTARFFEKRDWTINSCGDKTIYSSVTCHGNFFQMMHALFMIMIRKRQNLKKRKGQLKRWLFFYDYRNGTV